MKRSIWLGLLAVVIAAVAVSIIALPKGPEWTTSSPEALAEFELALQARMKLYYQDAAAHLEKAVELDPGFVMARLMLADASKSSMRGDLDRDALLAPVLDADVQALKPRERFFVERFRAIRDKRMDDADALLKEYLERYPDDPFLLEAAAGNAMHRGDNESAERLYRRLLEVGPNWVIAYNQLGYITMLQGRFAEAEEYFTSYRFIAPDQANPHDSLGELYLILGRLPEAEQSFETAIQIKPDFWESYSHLVLARALLGDHAGAHQAAQELEPVEGCPKSLPAQLDCVATFLELEMTGRWRDILELAPSACVTDDEPYGFVSRAVHRAASQLGEWKVATDIEARLASFLDEAKEKGESSEFDEAMPSMLHMQGVRLALSGDLAGAEKAFNDADDHLTYQNSGVGLFKIYNRLMLVETLLAEHRDADAHKLLAKVRAVNPTLVAEFEEAGLKMLRLPRS
jgi:tetratricopeptide (TPR) repeat protein